MQLNTSARACSLERYTFLAVRSVFNELKKLSIAELSQTSPARLMLQVMPCSLSTRCLNEQWFETLVQARQEMARWRRDYNEVRPHSSLGRVRRINFDNVSLISKPHSRHPPAPPRCCCGAGWPWRAASTALA